MHQNHHSLGGCTVRRATFGQYEGSGVLKESHFAKAAPFDRVVHSSASEGETCSYGDAVTRACAAHVNAVGRSK